jgi:hypothetical protein
MAVCRSLALRPLVTSSWWLNKRWMFSLFLPFQLLCKDTTILRNFQTIRAKIFPQKPVHIFSA